MSYTKRVEEAINKLREHDARSCKAIVYLLEGDEDKSPGHIADVIMDTVGWLLVVQTAAYLDEGNKPL